MRSFKTSTLRQAGLVVLTEKFRNAYKILVGKLKSKRNRRRREENITGNQNWSGRNWTGIIQMNMAINMRIPQNAGNVNTGFSKRSRLHLVSQLRLYSTGCCPLDRSSTRGQVLEWVNFGRLQVTMERLRTLHCLHRATQSEGRRAQLTNNEKVLCVRSD